MCNRAVRITEADHGDQDDDSDSEIIHRLQAEKDKELKKSVDNLASVCNTYMLLIDSSFWF